MVELVSVFPAHLPEIWQVMTSSYMSTATDCNSVDARNELADVGFVLGVLFTMNTFHLCLFQVSLHMQKL